MRQAAAGRLYNSPLSLQDGALPALMVRQSLRSSGPPGLLSARYWRIHCNLSNSTVPETP